MFKPITKKVSGRISKGLVCYSLALTVSAVEPLTETDMDRVSGEVGANLSNILNVAGDPAAGLTDALVVERYNEGKTIEPQAKTELRNLEEQNAEPQAVPEPTDEKKNIFEAALEASIQVERKADTTFTTSSEAQYREDKFTHSIEVMENGGIQGTRDVTIDSLKIENLRGARKDNLERNAGSLYITDIQAEVQTKLNSRSR